MNMDEGFEKKGLTLFLAVIIGLAFIGFMVGTRTGEPMSPGYVFQDRPDVDGIEARSYKELMENPLRSNEKWMDSITELRKRTSPALFADVKPATPQEREESLRGREERRAFAGAPPVVPHQVTQANDLACMECHGEGLKVQGRTASAMSHEFMMNCTQCHVAADGPMKMIALAPSVSEINDFAGLREPKSGTPASSGAPAMIPHPTHMREACMSCHGLTGQHGLRTSHPARQSCTQCHAPSAEFDQRVLTPGLLPLGVP